LPAECELDRELGAAVQAARTAVLESPADAERWTTLGMTYEGGDLFAQARQCYERALAARDDPVVRYRHSVVCAKTGDGEAAVRSISRAIELAPEYAPSYWRLGGTLFDLGRFEEALAAYQRCVALDPTFFGAWTGIARILLQDGDTARAIELLERLRKSNAEHAHVLKLLQAAYAQAGRAADAAAIQVPPHARSYPGDDPWQARFRPFLARPLLSRAREHLDSGEPAEVVPLLAPAVAEGAVDCNIHAYLARAYLLLGRLDEARATVSAAIARDPDCAILLWEQALIQEQARQPDEARATCAHILRVDPANRDAQAALARLGPGPGERAVETR
jgi:tetratricopeptide (TPR) repeat protein